MTWKMAFLFLVVVLMLSVSYYGASESKGQDPMSYKPPDTDDQAWAEAVALAQKIKSSEAVPFERTTHPDAQWFPEAGFGLFMHWGIHSVKGVQPSWAMIKDYPAGGDPAMYPPDRYYAQAKDFNPQRYDPDLWMAAAAKAGFTYAVLTAKHHDGYALWPTAFGDLGTRQYMGGRDLLKPYVDACRKHGLKVGLYFSPRDWHFPGHEPGYPDFDYNKRDQKTEIKDPEENQRVFEAFYTYTIGQLSELLTRYGKIDVLWFDGMGWPGVADPYTRQTLAWVRSLQPGIVTNDRWSSGGDFTTPEWDFPKESPVGWWENCVAWNGHWGYNAGSPFRPAVWAVDRLVRARAWGGNFLLNVGPAPDGTMPPGFYERCDEIAAWMAYARESVIGVEPSPGDDRANVPVTTKDGVWYLHVLPKHEEPVELRYVYKPESLTLVRNGQPVEYAYENDTLRFEIPAVDRTTLDDVVTVRWPKSSWEDAIRAFEEEDKRTPPPAHPVVFVGSSTIRMWDLKRCFPSLAAVNRGFGGSDFAAAAQFAGRIVVRYAPSKIVVYSGDNDISSGKRPEWVAADFVALANRIRHGLPDTPIIVLSIKPSVARWGMWDKMRAANAEIRKFCESNKGFTFLDMTDTILGPDGRPRADVFLKDGLHLNEEAYDAWTARLSPLLEK